MKTGATDHTASANIAGIGRYFWFYKHKVKHANYPYITTT